MLKTRNKDTNVIKVLHDLCQTKTPEKTWKAEMLTRGEGYM